MSQVRVTERSGTVHTGLQRLQLPSNAGITGNLSRLGKLAGIRHCSVTVTRIWACIYGALLWRAPRRTSRNRQALELGAYFGQNPVDAHLRSPVVGLLAHGAQELLAVVPVALKAGLAEAVAAGCGDGLQEHLQTDGAGELVLREDSCRADTCKPSKDISFFLPVHLHLRTVYIQLTPKNQTIQTSFHSKNIFIPSSQLQKSTNNNTSLGFAAEKAIYQQRNYGSSFSVILTNTEVFPSDFTVWLCWMRQTEEWRRTVSHPKTTFQNSSHEETDFRGRRCWSVLWWQTKTFRNVDEQDCLCRQTFTTK